MKLKTQFLKHLEVERGRSKKTIENYDRYLQRFFVSTQVKKLDDLTEEHVKTFRLYLNRQPGTQVGGRVEPMKHSTQNYYLIAVRTFFKFLRERGIDSIDSEHIQLAKVSQPSPDIISVSERMRLMRAPDTKTLEGKRDKAILELLVSTGMRISELTALSVDDVDVTSDTFCLPGTGNNTRLVLLSDTAKKCLKKYLAKRTDFDNALFIRYGRKANDGGELRISSRAVQRLLKKYATQSGIAKKVTPHVLRHSFATEQLQKGADLQYVQGLLGHVSIASTQVYAPIANKPASDTSQQNK